jgi:hypothetical protein
MIYLRIACNLLQFSWHLNALTEVYFACSKTLFNKMMHLLSNISYIYFYAVSFILNYSGRMAVGFTTTWAVSAYHHLSIIMMDWIMVFNATFNNISVISWWSVLLMGKTEVPGENNRPNNYDCIRCWNLTNNGTDKIEWINYHIFRCQLVWTE